MRRVFVSTALSVGLVPLLAACTLISDPFKPESFTPGLGNDAGESPALPRSSLAIRADGGLAAGSSCGGSSELPGCNLPLTPRVECELGCGPGCDAECDVVTECEPGSPCASQSCDGGLCPEPSCEDGERNQDETAADCGGGCPNDCVVGQACAGGSDCQTGVCAASGCPDGVERCCQAPACNDGVQNGTEPVIDCGDATCGSCAAGRACIDDSHCASNLCESGFCATPTCTDEARNGTESDIDCGGACGACAVGRGCNSDADCESAACQDGRCCGGSEGDCTRCARRLASILTCELGTEPVARDNCNAFLDCLANNPAQCPVRHADGCSNDPGGVCNHNSFGGNAGPGVVLADRILGTASCSF